MVSYYSGMCLFHSKQNSSWLPLALVPFLGRRSLAQSPQPDRGSWEDVGRDIGAELDGNLSDCSPSPFTMVCCCLLILRSAAHLW